MKINPLQHQRLAPLLQPHAINQHKQGKRRLRWIDMI